MFHQTIVIGNVGKDPESRSMPNGRSVVNFSLAANENWRDKDGEKQQHTEWYNCSAFGKTAEIIAEYVQKGNLLTVVGRQRTDKYEDKEGNTKYSVKLLVDSVKLMPKTERSSSEDDDRPARTSHAATQRREEPEQEAFDDDIPF